ncbi:MAG TPA: hypothetical protein VMZ71_10675, partial [Gemmataceae bacterium]|nr:hypothetical protein [Gemmataceae bacterium]
MTIRCILFAFAIGAAATARGAESVSPTVAVLVNGRGGSETPLELWRGEPVIVAVELRHPVRG